SVPLSTDGSNDGVGLEVKGKILNVSSSLQNVPADEGGGGPFLQVFSLDVAPDPQWVISITVLGASAAPLDVYLFFVFQPRPTLENGTVIGPEATITQGTNAPILLSAGDYTVNTGAPTSRVAALPATSPGRFSVSWSGEEPNGPGIASYTVYYSDNGG